MALTQCDHRCHAEGCLAAPEARSPRTSQKHPAAPAFAASDLSAAGRLVTVNASTDVSTGVDTHESGSGHISLLVVNGAFQIRCRHHVVDHNVIKKKKKNFCAF